MAGCLIVLVLALISRELMTYDGTCLFIGSPALRHRWKNPPVKFGALQVGKVLSSGETNNDWKGLLESLEKTLLARNFTDNGISMNHPFFFILQIET